MDRDAFVDSILTAYAHVLVEYGECGRFTAVCEEYITIDEVYDELVDGGWSGVLVHLLGMRNFFIVIDDDLYEHLANEVGEFRTEYAKYFHLGFEELSKQAQDLIDRVSNKIEEYQNENRQ